MINRDFIFIHIPRTAGRTIYSKLGLFFDGGHRTIESYIQEYTEPVVNNKFKFTVVRNPFSRAVSLWELSLHFYLPRPNKYVLGFEEWIRAKNNRITLDDDYHTNLDQMSYCKNSMGTVMMDKFLRFEKLQEDFNSIADRLHVVGDTTLGKIGGAGTDKPKTEEEFRLLVEKKIDEVVGIGIMSPDDKDKIMERLPKLSVSNYRDTYESQDSIDIVANTNRGMLRQFGYHF